jgi:hypothetical protein
MVKKNDKRMIRELAARVAEIAALPAQEETRASWRKLNGLQPERPMVMIDQVCWNEMNTDDALTLRCQDPECRRYEEALRRILFQWKHFRVDMVVEPFVRVPMAVNNTGFGIGVEEEILVTDPANSVVSHKFANQLAHDADLEKIRMPVVTHDAAETARRLEVAQELFDGILAVVKQGFDPSSMTVWDPISFWMGVEGALFGLIDRPEFMARLVRRVVQGKLALLDQLEAQGLLCQPQPLVHCTGAWTDDLPAPGFDAHRPRTQDLWMCSMAQMLSTVSQDMLDEFEIEPCMPLFRRFGLVYYGCCEPLDKKMDQVRKIPNLRKVSMSPWADEARGAAEIGRHYVYSRKPNPAHVAMTTFDEDLVRKDLLETRRHAEANGCPLEYILKDISTVCHEPRRLTRWAEVAMAVAKG